MVIVRDILVQLYVTFWYNDRTIFLPFQEGDTPDGTGADGGTQTVIQPLGDYSFDEDEIDAITEVCVLDTNKKHYCLSLTLRKEGLMHLQKVST